MKATVKIVKGIKIVGATFAAGLATCSPPILLALYVVTTDTGYDLAGNIDNAPMRAAGVILFVLAPGFVLAFGVLFVGMSKILRELNRETLPWMMRSSAILTFGSAILIAIGSFFADGLIMAAENFLIFGLGDFVCLLLGSVTWWYFSPKDLGKAR